MPKLPSPSMVVALTALVIAAAGAGVAADGGNYILGAVNRATTRSALVAQINDEAVLIHNFNTGVGATALQLNTAASKPPMRVTSRTRVFNLNSDLVDGKDSTDFASAASEGWHYIGDPGEPAFLNGWTNLFGGKAGPFQDAAYRIDQNGVVHLTGLIAGGAVDQPAFKLKGEYCPYWQHPFLVLTDDGTARPSSQIGRVDVLFQVDESGCDVRITEGNPSTFVTLDGISYRTHLLDDDVASAPTAASRQFRDTARAR